MKLSCAIGDGLYPHPQWKRIADLWEFYYPLADLDGERRNLLAQLQQTLTEFVTTLIDHRPQALRGRSLREAMKVEERTPGRLAALFGAWNQAPKQMYSAPPVARVRSPGPGESGRRPQPRRRKQSPGEAPHLLGDAQHARYFGLLRGTYRNRKCER